MQLVNQILQQSVSPSILTVVRGFSKVFVGEIVEKGASAATLPQLELTLSQLELLRTIQDRSHQPIFEKRTGSIRPSTIRQQEEAPRARRCLYDRD